MNDAREPLEAGTVVTHSRHGVGRVVAGLDATVIVRFGGDIEQVLAEELDAAPSLRSALRDRAPGAPVDAVVRAQALAIASVNDQWGVFSRSRVKLLPHQLWVCHRVTRRWPFRWLVADDVGLGKTIECGLVLMPLIASGRVRRLLILAPAKLVPQWQSRLKEMFDIRVVRYAAETDTPRGDFWATASMVVASLHTLRDDRRGARRRLIDADPWDLVVVDEAHHLNSEERTGTTLAYSLLAQLEERRKLDSLLFFTGTPHRGKDYGFFGLMHLLRPDLFDPERIRRTQLAHLKDAMIRTKLRSPTCRAIGCSPPVTVHDREYSYNAEEADFYRTLSAFILEGRAYAATLDGRAQTARMLVLTNLQKLAASSNAAIRNALTKRRAMLVDALNRSRVATSVDLPNHDGATLDDIAEAEETLPGKAALLLMQDEIERLDELLTLSARVRSETKIERLLSILDEDLFGEPVLLFTEYKATQALVVNALHRRFGFGSTTFINGDDRLDGVEQASGTTRTISRPRTDAANDFNTGKVRFLVSTEAGGEGIDLQDRCAVLVHVDMPWNPMRLHQRVGRLSRYGQRRAVSVYILRNPDTVEARIWGHLSEKLERIQVALSSAMRDQEPEDISQLVIGMAGGSVFDELFADAQEVSGERLKTWFDQRTATLGGRDVVDTVRDLFGSVSRFDFQQVGRDLPRVDLPDLERFFMTAVARHGHRVFRRHAGLEMKTPDAWKARHYAVRDRYDALVFERDAESERLTSRILGVGHVLFDTALDEARRLPVNLAAIEALSAPLLIVSVEDEVTGTGAMLQRMIFGITERAGKVIILRDWELLDALNSISLKSAAPALKRCQDLDAAGGITFRLKEALDAHLSEHAPTLVRPMSWPELLLIPTVGHGNR